MKKIELCGRLGRGKYMLCDDVDYEFLLSYSKWYFRRDGYVFGFRKDFVPRGRVYPHRLLLGAPKGSQVDHINHNGLDNRRSNIRVCSYAQNRANSFPRKSNKIGIKGVRKHRKYNTWTARVRHNGKDIHLGSFKSEQLAANAYDAALTEIFGDFALTNKKINASQ